AFEQHGPDPERTVCRLRQGAPGGLTRYEKRVYDRVASLAEGGVVPAPALLIAATLASGTLENKQGEPEHPVALALGAGFAAWWLLVALIHRCTDQRDTAAGRAAAARWLGYRDHLARD